MLSDAREWVVKRGELRLVTVTGRIVATESPQCYRACLLTPFTESCSLLCENVGKDAHQVKSYPASSDHSLFRDNELALPKAMRTQKPAGAETRQLPLSPVRVGRVPCSLV